MGASAFRRTFSRSAVNRADTSVLGREFDPRSNALNAWRLILATGVIVGHSFPLTGNRYPFLTFAPALQLLTYIWVDGFFAVSGFLITWSWFRQPGVRDYFVARALRILPGLWACSVVTAFIIAPVSVVIQGGSALKLLLSGAPIQFVLANSAVVQLKNDVGGTPRGVPWPGQWNGSLWTIAFEVMCYVAIAVLGVTGLLRRRWLTPLLLALALFCSTRLPPLSDFSGVASPGGGKIDAVTAAEIVGSQMARFAIMFFAGALIYQLRNTLPARWSLVGVCAAIVLGASFLPDYRLVAAIPLAYALIVSGALIHNKHMRLRNDLSYGMYIYAWPMQQFLVICGLAFLNPLVFAAVAIVCTLPLAALSWYLIEKPALSLKSRVKRPSLAGLPGG